MNQAQRIVKKFGTQQKLADALGCNQSVVAGWCNRGRIPAAKQAMVLTAAIERGIDLKPDDFFDVPQPAPVAAQASPT